MEESLAHIFAVVFGVFLLFFLPLLIVANKMDATSQSIIDSAVIEFVDNARATAVITDTNFERLVSKIDAAQSNCVITITHASKYAILNGSDVESHYFHYTKSDILNTIYTPTGDNQKYKMNNGDTLTVSVYNSQPTLGVRLFRVFSPGFNPSGKTIYSTYSGYVGNNPQQ